jgi:hypothetical protein
VGFQGPADDPQRLTGTHASAAGRLRSNALVFTEPIRSRMSAIQKTIEKRSGKYVGRFWSSPAFSNPQPNPQKV